MPPRTPDSVLRKRLSSLQLNGLVLGSTILRRKGYRIVMGTCDFCGVKKQYQVDNLLSEKTTGCVCQRGKKYPDQKIGMIIGERYDAIVQRCKNEGRDIQRRYGARGIENRFDSREDFVFHILDLLDSGFPNGNHELVLRRNDIDRIDNDGHYEQGNVRLVPRSVNNKNRENSHFTTYEGGIIPIRDLWHILKFQFPDFAFSSEWTDKLARRGLTGEEIFERSLTRRQGGKKVKVVPEIDRKILIRHGYLQSRRRTRG